MWTKNTPTEPGYYWKKTLSNQWTPEQIEIVSIDENKDVWFIGWDIESPLEEDDRVLWWTEKIMEPK